MKYFETSQNGINDKKSETDGVYKKMVFYLLVRLFYSLFIRHPKNPIDQDTS